MVQVILGYNQTDSSNAHRFASQHNKYLRHVIGNSWFYWNAEQWEPASEAKLLEFASQTVESMLVEAAYYFPAQRHRLLLWVEISRGRREEMIRLAELLLVAKIEQLKFGPWWLSTDEAAQRLGVRSNTLRVWRTRSRGPKFKTWDQRFRTRIRYCPHSVEEWRTGSSQ